MALGVALGMHYSDVIQPKALVIRVVLVFFGSILVSVVCVPLIAWILLGSPDGDSHGWMIPIMLSGRNGIPMGVLAGAVSGLFLVLKAKPKTSFTKPDEVYGKFRD